MSGKTMLKKSVEFIRRALKNRLIRFFIVGGINTVFGYSVFAFFFWIGLHYALAGALATVLGVLFNFGTIGKLVFNNFKPNFIFRFVGVYCVNYVLGVLFMKGFLMIGVNPYISGAILTLPMGVFGYFLHKTFVFSQVIRSGESLEANKR